MAGDYVPYKGFFFFFIEVIFLIHIIDVVKGTM